MKKIFRLSFVAFMKTIKIVVMMLLFLTVTNINAQEEQKTETTTNYTVNIETMDGMTIPYKMTVYETKKSKIRFAEEDKGKIDETAIYTPEHVTKLIYIDKYADGDYDSYIVLRYIKSPSDSFKFEPTKRGFTVDVDKKNMEYILGKGVYFVNNKDANNFFVTEFNEF
ncbi:hypothetical protein [Algibacter sp. L4_22]|uniref:hypothetical protein n=1 Tax=Algibacter sp. L4_22 TaxID=2942477 RepID=UPI00201B8D27|nr:hypothetical protein [Algibacter sp. L4_22]MCL5129325.1 hypothetical protein [Algibacter sp. L4_22]